MDRRIAGEQTQIQRPDPVQQYVCRTITRPEHVAVLPDRGSDITLAELDQDLRFQFAETHHHIRKQPVDRQR